MNKRTIRSLSTLAIVLTIFGLMPSNTWASIRSNNSDAVTGPGAAAEWVQDENGWWAKKPDGSYLVSEWYLDKGIWYHFDDRGYMQTGWITDNGVTYYLKDTGAMASSETLDIGGKPYTFDASGAAQWSYKQPIAIPPENEKSETYRALDAMCDQILAGIINDSMSKRQKAEAIYAWIRGNVHYSAQQAGNDWVASAYTGLRKRRGDCYTFYSVSNALLTRAGLPVIEVIRTRDYDHWWNMVEVEEGWYHFDTTPRSAGGYFCLWTDAQMDSYSGAHGGCFIRDRSIYPATP